MRFSCEIDIHLPRANVVALLGDLGNLHKWQPGIVRYERISSTRAAPGAQLRLIYRAGHREFEVIETVIEWKMPQGFFADYASKIGHTRIRSRFIDNGPSTRWVVNTEFQARGVMKFLSIPMRSLMQKQTLKMVRNFKAFAERAALAANGEMPVT